MSDILTISVRSVLGHDTIHECSSCLTIGDLKEIIYNGKTNPTSSINILWRETLLENNKTLNECGMSHGTTCFVIFVNGCEPTIRQKTRTVIEKNNDIVSKDSMRIKLDAIYGDVVKTTTITCYADQMTIQSLEKIMDCILVFNYANHKVHPYIELYNKLYDDIQ